jgi:hypothetical protein
MQRFEPRLTTEAGLGADTAGKLAMGVAADARFPSPLRKQGPDQGLLAGCA